MKKYNNLSGKIYRYTNQCAGSDNIQKMKKLAEEGCGLLTFINKNKKVKDCGEKE